MKNLAIIFVVTLALLAAGYVLAADKHEGHKHVGAETTEKSTVSTATYKCPMHPELTSNRADKCPQCGMYMTESGKKIAYKCPMHPEEVSDKASKCSKCRRTMVPSRFEGGRDNK